MGFSLKVGDKQDAPMRWKTRVAQRVCLRLDICSDRLQAVTPPNNHSRCSEDDGKKPPLHAAKFLIRSSSAGRHP